MWNLYGFSNEKYRKKWSLILLIALLPSLGIDCFLVYELYQGSRSLSEEGSFRFFVWIMGFLFLILLNQALLKGFFIFRYFKQKKYYSRFLIGMNSTEVRMYEYRKKADKNSILKESQFQETGYGKDCISIYHFDQISKVNKKKDKLSIRGKISIETLQNDKSDEVSREGKISLKKITIPSYFENLEHVSGFMERIIAESRNEEKRTVPVEDSENSPL